MDGRQRVGRLRPRSFDWVVGDARPQLRLHAPTPPPGSVVSKSLKDWLSSFLSPALRVLEICDSEPLLADEAGLHRAVEYYSLTSASGPMKNEPFGRPGWTSLRGDPSALARCPMRFDLIAWLREEKSPSTIFDAVDRLLAPRGLLALRTKSPLDARLGRRWIVGDVVTLADGSLGVTARRRSGLQAA